VALVVVQAMSMNFVADFLLGAAGGFAGTILAMLVATKYEEWRNHRMAKKLYPERYL
jgi:hypothetical protein